MTDQDKDLLLKIGLQLGAIEKRLDAMEVSRGENTSVSAEYKGTGTLELGQGSIKSPYVHYEVILDEFRSKPTNQISIGFFMKRRVTDEMPIIAEFITGVKEICQKLGVSNVTLTYVP